jgi:hypothetical protein
MIDAKTLTSGTEGSASRERRRLTFERVAGACSFAVVAIFVFQEFVLRLSPGPSTVDEWLAEPLPAIERLRMALMFALFFFEIVVFTGIALRWGTDAARAGLVFGVLACTVELLYRSVEMGAMPDWADAYRHAQDPAAQAILRSHVEVFGHVTASLYSVIRGAALATSLCFGAALWRSPGLTQAVALLFFVNAGRLCLHYLKGFVPALAPILDAVFIAVLAPLYVCVGLWLWQPSARPSIGVSTPPRVG